jgi:hypothetical protein
MRFSIYLSVRATLLLCFLIQSLCAKESTPFKDFILNENCVYEIPIGVKEPTTVHFTSKLDALEGVGITKEDSKTPVKLSYTEGKTFFTVKANSDIAEGSLNFVFKSRIYALKLIASPNPFRRVRFLENTKEVSFTDSDGTRKKPITTKLLLSLLDTAKVYHLLEDTNPLLLENVQYSAPRTIDDYGRFAVMIDEAIRFEPEDTIVFRVIFKNKTENLIYYAPQSLAVQVGDQLYTASLVDASGLMPAKADTIGYFCITGKSDGGRANLSLKNRFQVIVHEVELTSSLESL